MTEEGTSMVVPARDGWTTECWRAGLRRGGPFVDVATTGALYILTTSGRPQRSHGSQQRTGPR